MKKPVCVLAREFYETLKEDIVWAGVIFYVLVCLTVVSSGLKLSDEEIKNLEPVTALLTQVYVSASK